MNKKDSKPQANIYIDGANMFYAQQKMGWFIDWKKVKEWLETNYQIETINYFVGIKKGDQKAIKFLSKLKYYGFKIITKPLKKIKIIPEDHAGAKQVGSYIFKANFDVEIAFSLALTTKEVAVVFLFSGDSDFGYALNQLKKRGIKIIVCAFKKTLSRELRIAATRYILLEDIKEEIEFKKI